MKVVNHLKISLLSFILVTFTSCDTLTSYFEKYFNSERPPAKKTPPAQEKPPSQPTSALHDETTQNIYYIRGNNVSLLQAKNFSGHYVLSLYGVGTNVIELSDKDKTSKYVPLKDFLEKWENTPSIKASLILLRNQSDGTQKDVALDLTLQTPRANPEFKEVSYLVSSENIIKLDYISQNLGTAILLFDLDEKKL